MKTKSGKGFTLTELLVVVLVIAILAAVAVPIYKRTVERSHASDAIHVLDTVAAKQEVMWVETGTYANNFATLGAPVKGLNTTGNATIGDFTYGITNACATANKGDYTLYKNYITQETGCTGEGCTILKGLVNSGTVGCDMVVTNPEVENPNPGGDICDIDPSACCPSGTNWNGSSCISCTAPKVWNSGLKACQCGNVCVGGTPDPNTCVCSCNGSCSGGKVMTADCKCECPAELPNWNGTNCVGECSSPKIRWTGTTCECPLSAPIYVSGTNSCISACVSPKEWNGTACVCPENSVTARINCIATGGSWNDSSCTCACANPRTQMSGTSCVCPTPRTRFTGSSCECPVDRPIFHSASGTCIGDCSTPTEWNFSTLQCECSAAALVKKSPCTSSGGSWSDTTCTCSCASPRVLNSSTGECYCAAPRSYWTGTNCECPLINPNWNANNATCNPPCTDPKTYWDGTQCSCPTSKPKYVSASNACCLNTQGESCGGSITNTLTGSMPCTETTCACPAGSSLKSGYCCSDSYPNFINTTLGCCKTATAGTACGGGITGSAATGKIDCNTGNCMNCSGTNPTLRNGYCCLGSCTNGVFSGSGTSSCNCICSTGFKFTAATGNCETCGPEVNFKWTDNQCNYSCNAGYCKNSSGACIAIPIGQYRGTDEKCSDCTGLKANASWTGAGTTLPTTCAWACNTSYCLSSDTCISIPTGQWRNGNNCQACTNKPGGSSTYSGNGGTSNSCAWDCTQGTCYDGSTCTTIVTGKWRDGKTCADCSKPGNSMFTGPGDTTGVNSCPWTCNSVYCWNGSYCDLNTSENFRNASGNCVACAGANCWNGTSCSSTSTTLFRKPDTGLCVSCSGANCWDNASNACVATSNTIFRKTNGVCLGCNASTSCWSSASESCLSLSTTNFRNPTTGDCISCSGSNCWNGSSCVATSATNFRNSSGVCVACSGANCWNGSTCAATSATNFRNSSGVCVACSGANCWNGTSCTATTTTNFRNTSGVCVTCSGANCWSGTSCDATSATNFRNTSGVCVTCSGSNCWTSTTSSCAATITGQWRNTSGNCQDCTNKAANNSSYTGPGGTANACTWECNDGNCYNGSDCVTTPEGQYREGNNCAVCSNKPANTHYTSNGGVTNTCEYSGDEGYCYNTTSYVAIPVGQYRTGENCTACTNKPANTTYTGNGGTTNTCSYTGNTGYCFNGSAYVSIATGYWRSGEDCTACTNKPANTYYTGPGTTSSNCAYSGNAGYCYNGTSYVATPTGQYRSGETCTACTNKPANTTYTGNGGTTNSCAYTGNTGYCYNGSAYVAIPVGQYRSGENCTACTNKPAYTVYTGNGGTTNSCAYKADVGYCYNGTTYVLIPTGQYRNGETCTACSNKPANTTYTDDGGTSNACPYTGNSGYCFNSSSYVTIPTGQWRNGENCAACTNAPANTTYTSSGSTNNSCSYTGNTGYCKSGSSYIAIPTGQFRNGEDCVACTNKPANTYYTGNGGTLNGCPWACNSSFCHDGSACVSTPTGQWRNGNNCEACTNKPANTTYTGNGGTSNTCSYTGNGGYCNNGTGYVTIPTGYYRTGETCSACTNAPANTVYTSGGGTANNCSYKAADGYCYNGTSYIAIATGYWKSGETCTACTNKPANTTYTGNGGTSNSCAYTGNTGYCNNGSAYVATPTGYFRSGETCAACNNKPANSTYTGNGGTTNTCAWSCDSEYYLTGSTCTAKNINCNAGATKSQACMTNGTQAATCIAGSPNAWGAWGSCSCNSGYCSNGSTCIATAVGYYRNGESCAACTNKPTNTTYTGNGGTTNTCAYSGNAGYCYNGTSYVTIATGYWRNGEICAACTNKPANSAYTGAGGTTNSCSYTGNSGYCYNGSTYVTTPVGQYRNGETCAACTNKPANTNYTDDGGTSNNCPYVAVDGYCYNGTTYVSIPTGQYRNGETCTACTNKPANTSYTGNGGTSNSCPYTGDTGYCNNGTTYVSIPTGQYRSGENCTACSNKPTNTSYTGNGGTANNCPYTGNTGYCYNGTTYVSIPTGQYRSGEGCTACTNKPANTSYTGAGTTTSNCAYSGNSGYCNNGSAYVAIPTGQYRSGETCTACSNKPANSGYTGNGGTTNTCAWSCSSGYYQSGSTCIAQNINCDTGNVKYQACMTNGTQSSTCIAGSPNAWNAWSSCSCNTGYCSDGTNCVALAVGQWRNGEACASCSNKPANTTYTGNGGTVNNCAFTGNSGYCYNGSAYVSIPTGDYRFGETCTDCSNAPANTTYTGNGGTANACAYTGNSGYCYNGTSYVATPTGQYRSGENCTACTNKPANTNYTGNGGTTNSCSYTGASGYCYNGSSYVSIPTGQYRSGENCTACSNAPANTTYTGNGGTSNSCSYTGVSGYCYNGTSYVSIPTGQYRSGETCTACTNKPANTTYTGNGGTSNSCSYTGNTGYCFNGSAYVSIPTGQFRNGENCAACTNAPSNTYYTGPGTTSSNCAYSGNSGYCHNGSSYVAIPTGQYRSGETCTACTNKPSYSTYSGNGGTSNSCPWTCDAAYYLNGSACTARNINCNEGATKSQSCLTSGTQTATCLYGAPNAWGAWGSCSCNTGYCNNGSTCISIGVGYYRSGESCTGCNNAPANTYYTGAGTTTSNCSYTGNNGYCSNGTSYVTIPVGQYRSGENCASCTNAPANTTYTGNGGTANSCPYTGVSGYCWNGSSYVGIPTGQYRSGENCTACTNGPANTTYTGSGGTSNSCSYTGASGYCYNGSSYVSIPTGQYRSGENCTACTNKPANTSYTGSGGTTNSCSYTGNSGYCFNGSSYVAIATGQYRNGENCASCTNAPANTTYTGNGGTSNSCPYTGNSGYCHNGSSYVGIPTGYYRSGESCAACTNKPANTYYTGNGGTSNSCSYSGNSNYCWNGSSYVVIPTGQWRNGENCTACTNAPANTYYTSMGGTSNSCPYVGVGGYCYNGSSYVAIPTGYYRSGETCTACSNKPANSYYTSGGGTSNSCGYSGNSGYCWNGSAYVLISEKGQFRLGEDCTWCTNAPANTVYTTVGSCAYSAASGYCWNGSSYVSIPTGYYRNGEACTSCTNKPANTYYTSSGGTSNSCSYSGNSGYCWNGSSYVATPTGYYRSGETCTACTNKPSCSTYTTPGTTNNCGYSVTSGYCLSGGSCDYYPAGYYSSGGNCASCTNKPANTYYTGYGGYSNSCSYSGNSGYCWNGSSYIVTPTGYYRSGENCAACTNAPSNSYYTGNGGTSNSCSYSGNSGYCWNGSSYVVTPTGYYRSGESCASCTNAPSYAYYTSNGGTSNSCGWACSGGYCQSGSACYASSYACSFSGQKEDDRSGCSNRGARTRTCTSGSCPSLLYWGAYGACSCDSGYTGSTCASCASGYCSNGSACVSQTSNCSSGASNTSGTPCNGNGYATQTCNTATCPFTWGSFGSCSCYTGWCGSTCGTAINGTCTAGATSTDRSGCSNNGTRTRTCVGSCPNYWGSYGACSCDSGWTGSTCATAVITPVVSYAAAVVNCDTYGNKSYSICSSTSQTYYNNTEDCIQESSCMYPASTGASYYWYSCNGWITNTWCPSGYANDQALCNAMGIGYKCMKSASGSCASKVYEYSCDCPGPERGNLCYARKCPEGNETWSYYPQNSGSGSYLSCQGYECSNGATRSCNRCGTQTCSGNLWGPCNEPAYCVGDKKSCGNCGTSTWNGSAWSTCSEPACCPGATLACSGYCSYKTCSGGAWTACSAASGVCLPGDSQSKSCRKNGQFGTQYRFCSDLCQWGTYGTCLVDPLPYCECGISGGECCPCYINGGLLPAIQKCMLY